VKKIDEAVDNRLREIKRLKAIATNASKPLSPVPPARGQRDKIADITTKIVDFQEDINRQIDYLVNLKSDIASEICQLSDEWAIKILSMRYIEGKEWREIESELNVSRAYMFNIHKRGLCEYGNVLKKIQENR